MVLLFQPSYRPPTCRESLKGFTQHGAVQRAAKPKPQARRQPQNKTAVNSVCSTLQRYFFLMCFLNQVQRVHI